MRAFFQYLFGFIVVFAVQLLASPGQAASRCENQLETLKALAAAHEVRFSSAETIAAGDPIKVQWSGNDGPLPGGVSAWLVVVSIDAVRYSGSGFFPLPGGTPGPLEIGFAKKWTRAIVPLHTPDAPTSGEFAIKPFREGNFGLSWTIIAKSDCGEMQLRDIGTYKIVVEARHARLVVQDLYDYSRPREVIRTENGRHELRVFDGYYQVFDRRTGSKILDRRGNCPDFSPTGRFVAALAGRSEGGCNFNTAGENKPRFEIIDLVSGDVVANPNPPALWAHGDAFLVVASKWWKMLQDPGPMISLLVDENDGRATELFAIPELGRVSIDIANGFAYLMSYDGEPQVAYSLAARGQVSDRQVGWDSEKGESITEGPSFGELLERTKASGAPAKAVIPINNADIQPSHLRYIDDASEVFSDLVGEDSEFGLLVARAAEHKTAGGADTEAVQSDPMLTASLLRGVNVLASAKKAGRTVETLVGDELGKSFKPQIEITNPVDLVWDRMWQIDKMDISDDDKRARLEAFRVKTVKPQIERLVGANPGARAVLDQSLGCWPSGGSPYEDNLKGIWRSLSDTREVWLTHAGCMGIGTVGNLALNQIDLFVSEDGKTKHFNLMFDRRFYCSGNDSDCEYVHEDNDDGEEFTKKEQSYGSVIPAGNMKPDHFGAKIAQDFHQLIEFDSLLPAFLDARTLLLPVGRQMYVVDLDAETMRGPLKLAEHAGQARFSISGDGRHLMQTTADGGIAIYDFSSGTTLLQGRYVDDEIVIWDSHGHYLSTYEGAQYVHMRFVGRPQLYSLSRMADSLNRPDLIRAALTGVTPVENPDLKAPPRLNAELSDEAEAGVITINIDASAQSGLKLLQIYADGALVQSVGLEGAEWEGSVDVEMPSAANWLSAVAIDRRGSQSTSVELRLPDRSAERDRLFVVAIGTDQYEDSSRLARLNFAAADARNFANSMKNAAGTHYQDVQIVGPFIDSETLADDLDAALDTIGETASPGDTVMVFVAGHGVRSDAGQFFLATRTTNMDKLAATGLSWKGLAGRLAGLNARTFIFLDACHSGSVGDATNDGAADALLEAAKGSMTVIAASKGRQYSLESPAVGGGYFTTALASIVERRNDPSVDRDGSGTLDLDELYLALKRNVVEATDGRQTPWIARSQVVGKTPLL
ncbi:MAG: caspase domain-containing protein [Rhizobiaceae bacterium]